MSTRNIRAVQNDSYPFPNLAVCLLDSEGCDHEDILLCRDSVFEHGLVHNVKPMSGFAQNAGDLLGTANEVRRRSLQSPQREVTPLNHATDLLIECYVNGPLLLVIETRLGAGAVV